MSENPKSKRGGHRPGAGKKPGTGAYGEPTRPIRVPESQVPAILDFLAACRKKPEMQVDALPIVTDAPRRTIPVMSYRVPAGFPSPADDYVQGRVDLNEHLLLHREASFILRVSGWSMVGAGIFDGDEIIVDRAIDPQDGHVVLAVLGNELTVKRLRRDGRTIRLVAENPDFPDIEFREGEELTIWGVVTRVLHKP
ncbi:MAG: LexA family protein [Burkholderiales bacterium]